MSNTNHGKNPMTSGKNYPDISPNIPSSDLISNKQNKWNASVADPSLMSMDKEQVPKNQHDG